MVTCKLLSREEFIRRFGIPGCSKVSGIKSRMEVGVFFVK